MSVYNSSLFFVSAVAANSGMPALSEGFLKFRSRQEPKRIQKRRAISFTPLTPVERDELMQSILNDDWHE